MVRGELTPQPHGGRRQPRLTPPSTAGPTLTHGCTEAGSGYRVVIHGLRHSVTNWLKTAGVPTPDIQATLRHADPRTTATYLHTSAEERTQAINKLPGRPPLS